MIESLTAQENINKAKLCYEIGLITEERMLHVIKRLETEPEYDPIIDLPLDFQIEHELALRKQSAPGYKWWRHFLP